MPTHVKVQKWGNHLAIVIPSEFAMIHKIHEGSVIDLDSIEPPKPKRRRYKMSELMAKFKPEHRHPEWDVGPPVGKEYW